MSEQRHRCGAQPSGRANVSVAAAVDGERPLFVVATARYRHGTRIKERGWRMSTDFLVSNVEE